MTVFGFLFIVIAIISFIGLFGQAAGLFNKYEKPSLLKVLLFCSFILVVFGWLFHQIYLQETTPVVLPQ